MPIDLFTQHAIIVYASGENPYRVCLGFLIDMGKKMKHRISLGRTNLRWTIYETITMSIKIIEPSSIWESEANKVTIAHEKCTIILLISVSACSKKNSGRVIAGNHQYGLEISVGLFPDHISGLISQKYEVCKSLSTNFYAMSLLIFSTVLSLIQLLYIHSALQHRKKSFPIDYVLRYTKRFLQTLGARNSLVC